MFHLCTCFAVCIRALLVISMLIVKFDAHYCKFVHFCLALCWTSWMWLVIATVMPCAMWWCSFSHVSMTVNCGHQPHANMRSVSTSTRIVNGHKIVTKKYVLLIYCCIHIELMPWMGSRVCRIDLLCFVGGYRKRRLNQVCLCVCLEKAHLRGYLLFVKHLNAACWLLIKIDLPNQSSLSVHYTHKWSTIFSGWKCILPYDFSSVLTFPIFCKPQTL